MIIKFDIDYDADKLAKSMPKMIRKYMNNSLTSIHKGSKEALKSGKFTPISEATEFIRKKGFSPNAGYKKTSSTKPLRHTGNLFRSLK